MLDVDTPFEVQLAKIGHAGRIARLCRCGVVGLADDVRRLVG